MTPAELGTIAFYAVLAAGATLMSRRTPLALVGGVLILCVPLTAAGFYTKDLGTQVVLEAIQAGLVGHTARLAFVGGRRCWALPIVVLAIMDLALCAVQPLIPPVGFNRAFWFSALTNAVFFVDCLLVGAPGGTDAYRAWRDRRRGDRLVHRDAAAGHAGEGAGA